MTVVYKSMEGVKIPDEYRVEKVSDHRTSGPRKILSSQKIFHKKE